MVRILGLSYLTGKRAWITIKQSNNQTIKQSISNGVGKAFLLLAVTFVPGSIKATSFTESVTLRFSETNSFQGVYQGTCDSGKFSPSVANQLPAIVAGIGSGKCAIIKSKNMDDWCKGTYRLRVNNGAINAEKSVSCNDQIKTAGWFRRMYRFQWW